MSELRQLHIHEFDPELKAALIEAATNAEISLNDYAVGVLADHFGVRFRGTGRKSPGASVNGTRALMLPVPEPLFNRITAAVSKQPKGSRSKRAVVEQVMREHFATAATTA